MDLVVALYLSITCLLILAIGLYINYPYKFKIAYVRMNFLAKVFFALVLFASVFINLGFNVAIFLFASTLFVLAKTDRFAIIRWSN